MLAPQAHAVFSPEEALALSLARDKNGNLYVGTGHQGKVFRVAPDGKAAVIFTADEPDIFALAIGPDRDLFVGTSPEGKIYKVTPAGKSSVFYNPKAKYIWALLFDSQGHLYVGTGDKGQILRIETSGKGEVFFDSGQTHIMCLALDRDGNILAGSDPNGLVYRINPQGKAFVLYQASLPEIHDLVTDSRGYIYAAALGGPSGKGMPGMFTAPTPSTPIQGGVTTVTVTASTPESEKQGQTPPKTSPTTPSFNRSTPFAVPMAALNMPQGKGALIAISPDHTVETLWNSDKEGIFGLAVRGDKVLFSAVAAKT
jgi:sugar lactone lactonase YvrE